jgi:hypothetical protein
LKVFLAGEYWKEGQVLVETARELGYGVVYESGDEPTVESDWWFVDFYYIFASMIAGIARVLNEWQSLLFSFQFPKLAVMLGIISILNQGLL